MLNSLFTLFLLRRILMSRVGSLLCRGSCNGRWNTLGAKLNGLRVLEFQQCCFLAFPLRRTRWDHRRMLRRASYSRRYVDSRRKYQIYWGGRMCAYASIPVMVIVAGSVRGLCRVS